MAWFWNTPKAPLALAQSQFVPLSKPQRIGFVPIPSLALGLTTWNGTSKIQYEQLRRTGRQLSKIQFMRIRMDAKQLIVVTMLTCSGVPGGGTFVSKHSSDEICEIRKPHDREYKAAAPFAPQPNPSK